MTKLLAGTLHSSTEIKSLKTEMVARIVDSQVEINRVTESAKFPLELLPVLETSNGNLCQSDAIAFYLASLNKSSGVLGHGSFEEGLVQQWLTFGTEEIGYNLQLWLRPITGTANYNKELENAAKAGMTTALTILDNYLLNQTFLVGERVTLADLSVACALWDGYKTVFDPEYRASFPNVNRWFLTCINQSAFKEVAGELTLCSEVMDAAKISKLKSTNAPKKESKKEKAQKVEKAVEKPKEKDVPKESESLEDMADEEKKEKKAPNPLDLLPPSTFILDAWKRFYSNNDEKSSIEYFWQNYDPKGYSMWSCTYKYNDELTAIFMSSNLIGGFFQRLERARKYAFGSVIITGEPNKSKITGYWIFRGADIPAEVSEAADFGSYDFVKVDSSNSNVKEVFNNYLAWSGRCLPGKFQDGKIFK